MGRMGKKHLNRVTEAAKESLRDAELLGLPADLEISPAQLRGAVQLLLVCRSTLERQIVSLHLLSELSVEETADRLPQPSGRVRECFKSLERCVAAAQRAAHSRKAVREGFARKRASKKIQC